MAKPFQFLLLAFGVIALLAVGGEIIYSIAATTHGSTPARVVQVQAGPYLLTVSLYTYPAHASYALPFAIAPQQSISGTLTYEVSSIPDPSDVPATPVRASLSPDPKVHNGVQGDAEITVQGKWDLDILVTGSHWRYPALWTTCLLANATRSQSKTETDSGSRVIEPVTVLKTRRK
jgi:hypothetical protein